MADSENLEGQSSFYDENFFYWTHGHRLFMAMSVHVDDLLIGAEPKWLEWAATVTTQKFGKIKREVLPFTYGGMQYSRLHNGSIFISQSEHLLQIRAPELPAGSDETALNDIDPAYRTAYTTSKHDCGSSAPVLQNKT